MLFNEFINKWLIFGARVHISKLVHLVCICLNMNDKQKIPVSGKSQIHQIIAIVYYAPSLVHVVVHGHVVCECNSLIYYSPIIASYSLFSGVQLFRQGLGNGE